MAVWNRFFQTCASGYVPNFLEKFCIRCYPSRVPILFVYLYILFKTICNISSYLMKFLNIIAFFDACTVFFSCLVMKPCCLSITFPQFWSSSLVRDWFLSVSYGQRNWSGLSCLCPPNFFYQYSFDPTTDFETSIYGWVMVGRRRETKQLFFWNVLWIFRSKFVTDHVH